MNGQPFRAGAVPEDDFTRVVYAGRGAEEGIVSQLSASPRVFLGTQEISGLYRNLEAGMAEIGIDARLVITHPHPFAYAQATRNPLPARLAAAAVLKHRDSVGLIRILSAMTFAIASTFLLLWSLPRFDSYVFGWGISILPGNADIPILRFFRKRVVVVLGHGSEARPPYMSTPPEGTDLPISAQTAHVLNERTREVWSRVRRIERWSNVVVGLPTTGQFFSKPFVNFYRLGVSTTASTWSPPREHSQADEPIVVLHVPSNPVVKGSAVIRDCMAAITAEFPNVVYRELANVPHSDVIDAIRECTFVVDQLWSDIPMAAVGAEAAAVGRASIVSGYAWDVWSNLLKPEDTPPSIMTTPERLKDSIVDAIRKLDETNTIGIRAREFVRSNWSEAAVAENYLRVLSGDIPDDWMIAPSDVDYGWGCGVSKADVTTMVAGLVSVHGPEALRWSAAPDVYSFLGESRPADTQ